MSVVTLIVPLQAAYQEVHAFAKYGGAGSKSVYSMPTKSSGSKCHLLQEQLFLSRLLSRKDSAAQNTPRTTG
jgi:hypothetical protein